MDAGRERVAWHHGGHRSEEHTSELQSQSNLVCRLMLAKENTSELQSQSNVVCSLVLDEHFPGRGPMAGDYRGKDGVAQMFQRQMPMLDSPPQIDTHDI